MTDVNLTFTYTKEDCVKAYRLHYKRRMRLKLDCLAIFIAFEAGYWKWQQEGWDIPSMMCVIAGILLTVMLLLAFFVIPPLVYEKRKQWKQEYNLQFSENQITFKTDNVNSRLQWNMYTRVVEDVSTYLLYYGNNEFTIIPKRVFPSQESQQAFEQLLMEKKIST